MQRPCGRKGITWNTRAGKKAWLTNDKRGTEHSVFDEVREVWSDQIVQGPVSHVKKFLLNSKSNGKPLKSDIAPPPHDSTIIPAATLCT